MKRFVINIYWFIKTLDVEPFWLRIIIRHTKGENRTIITQFVRYYVYNLREKPLDTNKIQLVCLIEPSAKRFYPQNPTERQAN